MTLFELVDNTRTDKNTCHSYLDVYQELFAPIKYTARNILEVGILQGGSIRLWYDYFPNAQIYGVDKMETSTEWSDIKGNNRIHLFTGYDAYSLPFYNILENERVEFDIMIDDGPHTLPSQIYFVQEYSSLLSKNGILIVEDIQRIEHIEELKKCTPPELLPYVKVYDRREIKGRCDDILFIINKNN